MKHSSCASWCRCAKASASGSAPCHSIFGESAQDSGEIVFGDQTITLERGLEFIDIAIFDAVTGSTTNVRVPLLQTGETGGASLSGLGP